jgi:hypothetical protein
MANGEVKLMPYFHFVATLGPTRLFGLPDGDYTVLDASKETVYTSPVLDTLTGNLVGHGTLSQYRVYDWRLVAEYEINSIRFEINDNYVHITLQAINSTRPNSPSHLQGRRDVCKH